MEKSAQIQNIEQAEPQPEEGKSIANLIQNQQKHNQITERWIKITAGCAAGIFGIVLLAAVILIPKGIAVFNRADEVTSQAQEALGQVQEIVGQLEEGNPAQLVQQLNALAQEGQTALQQSVEELKKAVDVVEKIDIDALNKAVDNLGKAVSPLARLFGGK